MNEKMLKEAFEQVQAEEILKQVTIRKMRLEAARAAEGTMTGKGRLKNRDRQEKSRKSECPATGLWERMVYHLASGFRQGTVYRLATGGAVFALAASLVFFGMFSHSSEAQAAYIRLEGEASVGLSLDKNDRVIEVSGLDSSGTELLENLNLEGMTYQEAVGCFMDKYCEKEIFAEAQKEFSVTVEGKDEEKCAQVQAEVARQCDGTQKRLRHGKQAGQDGGNKGRNGNVQNFGKGGQKAQGQRNGSGQQNGKGVQKHQNNHGRQNGLGGKGAGRK